MNACASCACSGRRGLAGADRPHRLVGDDELLVRLRATATCRREHVLGLPRLALGLGLADAGDHHEPGLERGVARRRPTLSSVSPKSWRRSEWPTIAP